MTGASIKTKGASAAIVVLAVLLACCSCAEAVRTHRAAASVMRKCRKEATTSSCVPSGSCSSGVSVPGTGLCHHDDHVCCLPGKADECASHGGVCTSIHGPCMGKAEPSLCPGSAQIVCCMLGNNEDYTRPPTSENSTSDAVDFDTRVRNRISDITDYIIHNITSTANPPNRDTCWPLRENSSLKRTVTEVSWGDSRASGHRCHAGVDMFTAQPGTVVAVAHGIVSAVHSGFVECTNGWGATEGSGSATVALMIYHPDLDVTVNYGEVDDGSVRVHAGEQVRAGQELGVASRCGMLHFETYRGNVNEYHSWLPPSDVTLPSVGNICALKFKETKPKNLLDPRPLLNSLEGKFC